MPASWFIALAVIAASRALSTSAFVAVCPTIPRNDASTFSTRLCMAIDYKDPVVAAEFAVVQPMDFDDVEAELRAKGIPVPPTLRCVRILNSTNICL
jgi:hypothetical protein